MNNNFNLQDIRALIIDIDGTLWRGENPMPGLVPFFALLEQRDIAFVIVTNNSVETPAQFQQRFANFEVSIPFEKILTCSVATADYLRQENHDATIYVIGESGLRQVMRQAGFTIIDDASRLVEAVIVGGDRGLTYDKLKHAILLIQRGARFIGTNPDLLIPTEEGLIPEAGTILAAIQAATGVVPRVIGKPERLLFEMALEKLNSTPNQTVMLGDRLDTDILGGQRAGLKTILLTTGVDTEQTIEQKGIYPDAVFSGLESLIEAWQKTVG